jgi:hypothetical protein
MLSETDILTVYSLGLLGTVLAGQGKYKQAEWIHRPSLR